MIPPLENLGEGGHRAQKMDFDTMAFSYNQQTSQTKTEGKHNKKQSTIYH